MSQNINISESLSTTVMGENYAFNEAEDQREYIDILLQTHGGFEAVREEPAEFQEGVKEACLEGLAKGVNDFKKKQGTLAKSIYAFSDSELWYQDTVEPAVEKKLCENRVVKKYWEEPEWAGKDHKEVQCGNLARIVSGAYPSYVSHKKRNEPWCPNSIKV
ncbi:hypothetical protein GF343_02850 [Candidatus Woesearchaeota archaeon]|nr:hypothetical protein [Candidatus Woesearchaeota archaeon]